MVEGGSEVRFINSNDYTLSYSPVTDLYLFRTAKQAMASQRFYGINPQQQVEPQQSATHHQHTDLGWAAFLCGYSD